MIYIFVMYTLTRDDHILNTLDILKNLYPSLFFDNQNICVPLHNDVFNNVKREFKKRGLYLFALNETFERYRNYPDYLCKVALGYSYIDFYGNRRHFPTVAERELARDKLMKKKKWNNQLQKKYISAMMHDGKG